MALDTVPSAVFSVKAPASGFPSLSVRVTDFTFAAFSPVMLNFSRPQMFSNCNCMLSEVVCAHEGFSPSAKPPATAVCVAGRVKVIASWVRASVPSSV